MGKGHWLMEEALGEVMLRRLVAFINQLQ